MGQLLNAPPMTADILGESATKRYTRNLYNSVLEKNYSPTIERTSTDHP